MYVDLKYSISRPDMFVPNYSENADVTLYAQIPIWPWSSAEELACELICELDLDFAKTEDSELIDRAFDLAIREIELSRKEIYDYCLDEFEFLEIDFDELLREEEADVYLFLYAIVEIYL